MRLIIISGNLVKDPEVKQTQNGKNMCQFRIANNRKAGNKDDSIYASVVAFGKTGDFCAQYLRKGSQVIITGIPSLETYQGRDGQAHFEMRIMADSVDSVGGQGNNGGQQPYNGGYAQQQPPQQPYYGQQPLPQQPPMTPPAEGPQPPIEDSPF